MNCPQCQRRLMCSEKPEFPDFAVAAHLAGCMTCRDFQRQLQMIEANVPRIPLPPSTAKDRLLHLLQTPASPNSPLAPPVADAPGSPGSAGRVGGQDPKGEQQAFGALRLRLAMSALRSRLAGRWREAGIGLAAAVVLVACGLWLGNHLAQAPAVDNGYASQQVQSDQPSRTKPPLTNPFDGKNSKQAPPRGKTLMAKVMECDLKLAEAQTPADRVTALAELAAVLQKETTLLSKSAGTAELNKLAGLYKQVIQDGVVPRARELPMEQRKDVLSVVAVQLGEARREAEQLALSTPRSAEALQTIAAAARDGDAQLRELMQEGSE
jgi:hypothetical protein